MGDGCAGISGTLHPLSAWEWHKVSMPQPGLQAEASAGVKDINCPPSSCFFFHRPVFSSSYFSSCRMGVKSDGALLGHPGTSITQHWDGAGSGVVQCWNLMRYGLGSDNSDEIEGEYTANPPGFCQWSSRRNSDFFQKTFSPKYFLCPFAQVLIGILQGKCFSSQNPQWFHRE